MTTTQEKTKFFDEFPALGLFNSFYSNALKGNKSIMENACRAVQQEMLDFAILRLRHTEDALEAVKDCKDPLALASVQQKWMAETIRDYFEESGKIGERMRQTATEELELAKKSRETMMASA